MKGAFRDLHFGIMSTFVNVKIVCFAVIVNKDRKTIAIAMVLHDDRFNSYHKECNQGHFWDQMKQQHDYIC